MKRTRKALTFTRIDSYLRISSIDYNEKEHEATISFEKASAAKTALMVCISYTMDKGQF